MLRLLVISLVLISPVTLQAAEDAPPAAAVAAVPALKSEVVVTGALVRIGDLVEHAGPAANVAVFRAPDLGQTGAVAAARVLEALRGHGVLLVDTRDITEVAVTRSSRVITAKAIEERIIQALAGRYGLGEAENLTVAVDRDLRPIQVEVSAGADLQVARAAYDPRTGRFDISFELPGSAVARQLNLRFTGSASESVAVPILTRALARGDVVKQFDVATERRPKNTAGPDVLTRPTDIVGLAARHALRPGQPLKAGDLMKPELVQRNEPVTIVYETPGIVLSVRGKALETGAEGDLVNVLNVQSKRTLQAVVSGPGRVTIASPQPRPATARANPPVEPRLAVARYGAE